MKVCIFDCDIDRGSNLKDSVEDTGYQAVPMITYGTRLNFRPIPNQRSATWNHTSGR
jgi:hypothetical protein